MPAKPKRAGRPALGALLAILLLAAFAGHALLWSWLCGRLESGFAAWAAGRRAEGWLVEHGTPRRGGWPLAATLTLPDFRMEGGAGLLPGGLDWRAEALALRLSPPRLDRLALGAPGRHSLRLGGAAPVLFTASSFQAALPLEGAGVPDEVAVAARGLRFDAPGGAAPFEAAAASLDYGVPRDREGFGGAALRASAEGLVLPLGLPGTERLGRVVDRIGLDLALTRPFPPGGGDPARRAAAWRDSGGALEVRTAEARWGEAAASATATLVLDAALQPAGTGTLRLAGGEALLGAATSAGLLPPFSAAAARVAWRAIGRAPPEGGPARAELPVDLRDRTLRLGPVPLGRLPALDWTPRGRGAGPVRGSRPPPRDGAWKPCRQRLISVRCNASGSLPRELPARPPEPRRGLRRAPRRRVAIPSFAPRRSPLAMSYPSPSDSLVSASFHVLADTCPGLLPRLLQPLAKRDLAADEFHAWREGDATRVELALRAMPAGMVHLVAGNLGQVVGVREVRVAQHAPEVLRRAA